MVPGLGRAWSLGPIASAKGKPRPRARYHPTPWPSRVPNGLPTSRARLSSGPAGRPSALLMPLRPPRPPAAATPPTSHGRPAGIRFAVASRTDSFFSSCLFVCVFAVSMWRRALHLLDMVVDLKRRFIESFRSQLLEGGKPEPAVLQQYKQINAMILGVTRIALGILEHRLECECGPTCWLMA